MRALCSCLQKTSRVAHGPSTKQRSWLLFAVRGVEGTVEELGLASVTLRSEDGRIHHVANRILLEGVVSKTSQRDR
jgi:small-conductance mechanosensitive channel